MFNYKKKNLILLYMWNLIEDLKYGKLREKMVIKYLNENIKDKFKLYENEKQQVDFRNKEIIGELKSRTIPYEKHNETFFGYNKIKYLKSLENDNRKWNFYFLFTNGLFMWEYNEKEYKIKDFVHKEKGLIDQVYVPIKYLKCINKNMSSNKIYL